MATSIKTNAETQPAVLLSPATQIASVVRHGKMARDAALLLTCSAVAFLLNVNHFRLSSDKDNYLSLSKATDEIKTQLDKAAGVKGGMLDIYVTRATGLYRKLILKDGKPARHVAPLLVEIAALADDDAGADKASAVIKTWLDTHAGIRSLADLSRTLGYSTGKTPKVGEKELTVEKASGKIESTLEAIEAFVESGGMSETAVAQSLALNVSNPLVLAQEAIKRVTDIDGLWALAKAIESHVDTLLASKADDAAKAAEPVKAKPTKGKAKEAQPAA